MVQKCEKYAKLSTKIVKMVYRLLEFPIPTAAATSVTKSVKWRYLGNQARYHRSAGVKTTGKKSGKKRRSKLVKMVKMVQNRDAKSG